MGRQASGCILVISILLSSIVVLNTEDCIPSRGASLISIDGEEELKGSEYLSSGTGIQTDPYIIEGFPRTTDGISLRNLTSHVLVRDHSFDTSTEAIAVRLENVGHCTMDNISISSHDHTINAIGRTNLTMDNSDIRDIPSLYKVEEGNDILPLKLSFTGDLIIRNSSFRERSNSSGYHLSVEIEANRITVKNSTFYSFQYLPLYSNEDYLLVEDSTFIGTDFRPRNSLTPPIEKCLVIDCTFNNSYIQLHWAFDLKIINNSFMGPGSYIYFGSPLPRPDWIRNEIRGNTFEGSMGLFSDFPTNSDYIMNWNITENYFANSTYPAIEWRSEYVKGIRVWKNVFYHNRGTGDEYKGTPQVYIETNSYPSDDINMSVQGVGNYWRDFTGPDLDGNGIVDSPYLIDDNSQWPTISSFYDHFPVTNPYFDVTRPYLRITEPEEGEISGMKYVVVRWEVRDDGSGLDSVLVSLDGENWNRTGDDNATSVLLEDGFNTIYVKAVDRAGLFTIATRPVYVDTIEKAVEVIRPKQGEFLGSEVVEVEWQIDPVFDLEEQEVLADSERIDLDTGLRSTRFSLSDGPHSLSLICRDVYGTVINETVDFNVEVYGPEISIHSPVQNFTYSNSDIRFSWDVFDGNGINSTHFRIDSDEWVETDVNGPFQHTAVLEEGSHSFEVRAFDNFLRSSKKKVDFFIGPSPYLEITFPPNGTMTTASSIEVQWEPRGGFTPASYRIRNMLTGYTKEILEGNTWQVPLESNRENMIKLIAYDPYDNHVAVSVMVIRDNEEPVVVIANKTPYRNGKELILSWVGSDEFGMSGFLVRIDDGQWEEAGTEFSLEGLEEGSHTITVRAVDLAGNHGEDTYVFILDTIAPGVGFSPDAEEVISYSSRVDLAWYARDDEGLERQVLRIDETEHTLSEDEREWKCDLEDGYHYVRISALDMAGNSAFDTLTVLVDTEDPGLLLEEVPRYSNRTRNLFCFSARDNLGLSMVRIVSNGEDLWNGSEPGVFSIPLILEEGAYSIMIEAVDISGRRSTINATIIVDTTPPIPIALDYTYLESMFKVQYRAEDTLSGIREMVFETGLFSDTVVENEGTVNFGSVLPGIVHIKWTLIDNAGNSVVVERDLELDEPPTEEREENIPVWLILVLIIILISVGILVFLFVRKGRMEDRTRKAWFEE